MASEYLATNVRKRTGSVSVRILNFCFCSNVNNLQRYVSWEHCFAFKTDFAKWVCGIGNVMKEDALNENPIGMARILQVLKWLQLESSRWQLDNLFWKQPQLFLQTGGWNTPKDSPCSFTIKPYQWATIWRIKLWSHWFALFSVLPLCLLPPLSSGPWLPK